MKIIIPSYNRAGNIHTHKLFKNAVIAVHKFEVEEYKKHYSNELLLIPNELEKKGMAVIRNFILDNIKDDEILMLDDDIKYFGYYEKGILYKMKEEENIYFFKNAFRMTKELNTGLWGVNLQSDKKFYREYSPFSLSSVVLGPCMGIIKSNIRFDDNLSLKEDYDYSIQILKKNRKILRFNKFHYSCEHIKKRGGCSNYRTLQKENEQAELFLKKWGNKIVKIKRRTQQGNMTINPVVKVPIRGI